MLRTIIRLASSHPRVKMFDVSNRPVSSVRLFQSSTTTKVKARAKRKTDSGISMSHPAAHQLLNKQQITKQKLNPREILAAKLSDADEIGVRPPSHFRFSYIATEQEQNIQDLVWNVLQMFSAEETSDKQLVHGAIFYGMSGSGKSRMAKELPNLMAQVAQNSPYPHAAKLVQLLQNRKEITIDWANGSAYKNDEEDAWPPDLVFGLRVAAKYWFPSYSFVQVRAIVARLPQEEQKEFKFDRVMEYIMQENSEKPMEERYSMLYIANDEFQLLRDETNKYTKKRHETLSRAIAREFGQVCRTNHQKLFIFGSFVGVGFTSGDIFVHPTFGLFPGYCIRRLSVDSMMTIVEKELKEGKTWKGLKDLPRLLTTFGGNPRVLEVFIQAVATYYNTAAYDTRDLFLRTQKEVASRYPNPNLGAPTKWPALLSFAGYSVSDRTSNIAWKYDESSKQYHAWTAGNIENLGFISLRAPTMNETWASNSLSNSYNPPMVLDTPLMIANMAMSGNSPAQKGGQRIVSPSVIDELVAQFRNITSDFFMNAYGFEKLALNQLVFRWNMFNFASVQDYVPAQALFYGGNFTEKFSKYKFVLEEQVLAVDSANPLGNWAQTVKKAEDRVEMQSRMIVEFKSLEHRAIHFGGKNIFDGHLRLKDYDTNEMVIIWMDAKHTSAKKDLPTSLATEEILDLETKLNGLAATLPGYKHLLIVITNRKYKHNPKTPIDDNMCIIARDGLTFGMSPWFSLVAQVELHPDQPPLAEEQPLAKK